jgi:hypothetical protein
MLKTIGLISNSILMTMFGVLIVSPTVPPIVIGSINQAPTNKFEKNLEGLKIGFVTADNMATGEDAQHPSSVPELLGFWFYASLAQTAGFFSIGVSTMLLKHILFSKRLTKPESLINGKKTTLPFLEVVKQDPNLDKKTKIAVKKITD